MSKPVVSWFHGVGMAVTMKPWFRGFMVAWHISPSPPWNQVTCFVVSWLGPLHHWDIRWRSVAPSSSPPEEVARHLLHTFKRETLSPRFFLLLSPRLYPTSTSRRVLDYQSWQVEGSQGSDLRVKGHHPGRRVERLPLGWGEESWGLLEKSVWDENRTKLPPNIYTAEKPMKFMLLEVM